jgi:acetoin utilization deacetylase AcuC-like enzyme
MGEGHPESPNRIASIENGLIDSGLYQTMQCHEAPAATNIQLLRAHEEGYIDSIEFAIPEQGYVELDGDTSLNPFTYMAAIHAAGATVLGVDLVLEGKVNNAFCNVRPPGHHAMSWRASGFCIFNNVAIAALHAIDRHGLKRVAIADFDVHHGNGTEEIFHDDSRVMLCSTFQYPFYPNSGTKSGNDHIINTPLSEGAGSEEFREAVRLHWLPALERFQPELVLISAGFDAHQDDGMSGLNLSDDDYAWVTSELMRFAGGKIVSVLEGGYELGSLARSSVAHVGQLVNYTKQNSSGSYVCS